MAEDTLASFVYWTEFLADDLPRDIAHSLRGIEDVDVDDQLRLLHAIAECRRKLSDIAKVVEASAEKHFDRKRPHRVVDGLGEFTRRSGTKRNQWDREALTAKVAAYALDERAVLDPGAGDIERPEDAVAHVLGECFRMEPRVTPIKARGIDPDEYCEKKYGPATIQLPSN